MLRSDGCTMGEGGRIEQCRMTQTSPTEWTDELHDDWFCSPTHIRKTYGDGVLERLRAGEVVVK